MTVSSYITREVEKRKLRETQQRIQRLRREKKQPQQANNLRFFRYFRLMDALVLRRCNGCGEIFGDMQTVAQNPEGKLFCLPCSRKKPRTHLPTHEHLKMRMVE